jgi:hypothetical protein
MKRALKFLECGATAGLLVFTALAALYWLKSASIPIRDNLDAFIADLWRAGTFNGTAAMHACLAAVCQIIATLCRTGRRWLR